MIDNLRFEERGSGDLPAQLGKSDVLAAGVRSVGAGTAPSGRVVWPERDLDHVGVAHV
jgi:hypothetical protein